MHTIMQKINKKRHPHKHLWFLGVTIAFLFYMLFSHAVFAQNENQPTAEKVADALNSADTLTYANKSPDQIVLNYQKNRQAFKQRMENISDEVMSEQLELRNQITSLKGEIASGNQYLEVNRSPNDPEIPQEMQEKFNQVREKSSRYQTLLTVISVVNGVTAHIISPFAFAAKGDAEKILFIFLPITILNIFLYLLFRQREAFIRHKKLLIMILVAVIIASATTLMAAPVNKRQLVESKLRFAETMLTLSGNLKAIAILENKESDPIVLPTDITTKDSRLKIYKMVNVDSTEYYISLAALYSAEGNKAKAIEAVSKIAEKNDWKEKPSPETVLSVVTYLVDNGHNGVAGKAITNHAANIVDSDQLLELAKYLREHSLQVSADHVMILTLKNTKTTDGLVKLAGYFFETDKMDRAENLLVRGLEKSNDIGDIILVLNASVKFGTKTVQSKVPEKASKLSGDSEQLMTLANIYHSMGESDHVASTLQRAINKSSSMAMLKSVTAAIIGLKQGPLMDQVRIRVIELNPAIKKAPTQHKEFKADYSQCLSFVEFLIEKDRQEDAAKLFDDLVASIREDRAFDEDFIELMLNISHDAVTHNLKSEAATITFRLISQIKPRSKAYTSYVALQKNFLQSIGDLPNTEQVSIPLYNGLLNEDINKLSHSEQVYMQAVIESLNMVNTSYGYSVPETLNEYYLLGRLWERENRTNVLSSLDRVYTLLEKRLLENMKEKERERVLGEAKAELAILQEERDTQLQTIRQYDAELEKRKAEFDQEQNTLIEDANLRLAQESEELKQLTLKVILKLLSTIVLQLIALFLLVGCVFLAWKHSQKMQEHKTYGFFTRFIELNGWIRVASLIGMLSGFILIILSQLLQIAQKIHEIALQGLPKARYAGSTGKIDGPRPINAETHKTQNVLTKTKE